MASKLRKYGRSLRLRDLVNRKTIGSRIIPGDTVRGCTYGCIGCYAARDAKRSRKDFFTPVPCILDGVEDPTATGSCILRIGTSGDPSIDWKHSLEEGGRFANVYYWTKLVKQLPGGGYVNLAVTLDPYNERATTKAIEHLRDGMRVRPVSTLVFVRIYQGSPYLTGWANHWMDILEAQGFSCVALPVRLTEKEAEQVGVRVKSAKQLDYSRQANCDRFVCGGQHSGKCRDCELCYHFFTHTHLDPGHREIAKRILFRQSTRT